MLDRFSGLLTRNSRAELDGAVVNSQKKIFDAIAAASIFTNCAGIDTNNSQVITMSTFTKFLETRQMEVWTEEQVKALIYVSHKCRRKIIIILAIFNILTRLDVLSEART